MTYIWQPPRELVDNSNVKAFMDRVGAPDYRELVRRSTRDIVWFWRVITEELGVEWFREYEKVLDTSRGVEWADWFIGGEVNVVHNILDVHAGSPRRNNLAFIWAGEDGTIQQYTYGQLNRLVNQFANFLKSVGVSRGDVVASYIPMLPETIITMLATLKLGAVFTPIFSGFAPQAVATRLADAQPKVVVTVDYYLRRGARISAKPSLDEAEKIANVRPLNVVVQRFSDEEIALDEKREIYFHDAVRGQSSRCETTPVGSNDPALLLYTSGTTGKPKGAVISHIGALLQPSKEIHLNLDLKRGDILMWVTDIGWMMGPWQIIGAQQRGATHLIFEGAIDYPGPDRLWRLIEEQNITHLGLSATVVRMLKRYGDEFVKKHDLSCLRVMGNTGEPIDPDSWMWLMKVVGDERCPIINLTGGTELFGCFLLPSPVVELKPSTLWGPGLGMDVDVFDEQGRPVRGEVGYLVCKKPAPSMTRGFWRDPQRYIETYWTRFPGVWYHGDWASIDSDGHWYLHGRADDTIKVAGKRIGPAEIESVLNSHPSIAESACIGVPSQVKGEEIVCFITLKQHAQVNENFERDVVEHVSRRLGKAFAPSRVVVVSSLPRTRSGKIMRRLVRTAILGGELGDVSALENPESLEEIKRTWNMMQVKQR